MILAVICILVNWVVLAIVVVDVPIRPSTGLSEGTNPMRSSRG